jgi:outer membrane translocation and assembly module TamA
MERQIPTGGNGEVLFSGEVRADLFRIRNAWLTFVPFVDAGDVTPRVEQLDLAHLHVAVGGDLEYQTPVGPLRAGVGVRLNRVAGIGPSGLGNPDAGSRLAFHLTVGEAF